MGPATRKLLNGVIVGERPGVPKEVRARIRSGIHKLVVGVVPAEDQPKYLRSLVAQIRQAETINRNQIRTLREQLVRILEVGSITKEAKRVSLQQLGWRAT